MKNLRKFSIFLLFVAGQVLYSQQGGYIIHNEKSKDKAALENVEGNPYYNSKFLPATIGDAGTVNQVRYNAFLDVVEVSNDKVIYELPKVKENGIIKFKDPPETLFLIEYSGDYDGYYFLIEDGKNKLIKKIRMNLITEKQTVDPQHQIKEGKVRYNKLKPAYFIRTEKQVINIPKNAKDLIFYFPDNKDKLIDFIKSNKIKLNKEEDLIKLVHFLNQ